MKQARRQRRPVAFVLYDDDTITEISCWRCVLPDDPRDAAIYDKGAVVCKRCGGVCQ